MTGIPIPARVAAARALLEGWSRREYESLPVECQANLQEAREFLDAAARGCSERETKK